MEQLSSTPVSGCGGLLLLVVVVAAAAAAAAACSQIMYSCNNIPNLPKTVV
jgi:hypothetical protein